MVKCFSTTYTFAHPFDAVSAAFLRKYPNDRAPHVKSVDSVERSINAEGHLVIKRVICCESSVPKFLSALGFGSRAVMCETTTIDPVNREMTIRAQNLSYPSLCLIKELCKYKVDTSDPERTIYEQNAEISTSVPLVRSKVENYSFQTLVRRSAEGIQTVGELCDRIKRDGVSSLLPERMISDLKTKFSCLPKLEFPDIKLPNIDLPDIKLPEMKKLSDLASPKNADVPPKS